MGTIVENRERQCAAEKVRAKCGFALSPFGATQEIGFGKAVFRHPRMFPLARNGRSTTIGQGEKDNALSPNRGSTDDGDDGYLRGRLAEGHARDRRKEDHLPRKDYSRWGASAERRFGGLPLPGRQPF